MKSESVLRARGERRYVLGRLQRGGAAWELPVYPRSGWQDFGNSTRSGPLSRFIAEAWPRSKYQRPRPAGRVPARLLHRGSTLESANPHSCCCIFFDLSSFATRKNPEAVLAMFEAIRAKRRFADIQLILKVRKAKMRSTGLLQSGANTRGTLPGPANERPLGPRSLINCCDCFVSMHRAEGFGRGTGEAMFLLGRVALLATGWSANV